MDHAQVSFSCLLLHCFVNAYSSTIGYSMTGNQFAFTLGGSALTSKSIIDISSGWALTFTNTVSGTGGDISLTGQESTAAHGGKILLFAGKSDVSTGGLMQITGGATSGNGTLAGSVVVAGGDGSSGTGSYGGNVFIYGGIGTSSATNGNVIIGASSAVVGAANSGVIFIANCTSVSSLTPPVGGCLLYSQSGHLYAMNPAGTISSAIV